MAETYRPHFLGDGSVPVKVDVYTWQEAVARSADYARLATGKVRIKRSPNGWTLSFRQRPHAVNFVRSGNPLSLEVPTLYATPSPALIAAQH